jgi:hypothetical protein
MGPLWMGVASGAPPGTPIHPVHRWCAAPPVSQSAGAVAGYGGADVTAQLMLIESLEATLQCRMY